MQNTRRKGQTNMNLKEQLKKRIEEERVKLNVLVASGGKVEETYRQSLMIDRLLEQYMECES